MAITLDSDVQFGYNAIFGVDRRCDGENGGAKWWGRYDVCGYVLVEWQGVGGRS